SRHYTSTLFVSGRKANEITAVLTPYLDIEDRIADLEKLQKNLIARGVDIDAKEIKKAWEFYKSVYVDKKELDLKVEELSKQIKSFYEKDLSPEDEVQLTQLNFEFKSMRQDFKSIRNTLWNLEETIIEKILKLPNEVDEKTPLQSPTVMKSFGTLSTLPATENRKNHIEIGEDLGLLEYRNPMQYYLCNDAALFELGVLSYAGNILSENDMIRVAGADFSRSLMIEGSGLNHEDPMDSFVIDNHSEANKNVSNHMHLVGGASLISFLAMHAKQVINPKNFPIKYFATGRQYTPFPSTSTPIGLFTVSQASVAHAFALVKDVNSQEYHELFEGLLNTVCKLYDNICDHYQVVTRPVTELRPWETMRVSFELWSSFSKQYIEVGHLSVCGQYLSKRLLIAYQTPDGRAFPSVISGTVLSVPRLLGCLLEQDSTKFVIPKKIADRMP
ncbi:Serine--tRNA ligase, mitochondrial, partial [Dufourea novaeangliae]